MRLRSSKTMLVLGLLLLFSTSVRGAMDEWRVVHGNIVAIFPQQQKIMLESSADKRIYVLTSDCQILRSGAPTSLDSLRPIATDAFQDALCWVNCQGHIEYLLVNYSALEQNGILTTYDIFGNSQ